MEKYDLLALIETAFIHKGAYGAFFMSETGYSNGSARLSRHIRGLIRINIPPFYN